jgi:Skp family chaperone for outer membrane proteins
VQGKHIASLNCLNRCVSHRFNLFTSKVLSCAAVTHTHLHPHRRLNDAYADEQRKHDAAINQLRAEAAAREAALQERSRQAAELTQQLEAAGAALGDEQRKAESLRQLQQTTSQQLEAMRHTHAVGVVDVLCMA